jgi:hypothetical protein
MRVAEGLGLVPEEGLGFRVQGLGLDDEGSRINEGKV